MPSPTVVSFTSGAGPEGYTALSGKLFGEVRARTDAGNVLPFLAGRARLAARAYPDQAIAWARVSHVPLAAMLGAALVLGLLAGAAVPRLPNGAPRRGTGMWGWVAVITADGLLEDARGKGVGMLERGMEVEEVEKAMGNVKVRYNI